MTFWEKLFLLGSDATDTPAFDEPFRCVWAHHSNTAAGREPPPFGKILWGSGVRRDETKSLQHRKQVDGKGPTFPAGHIGLPDGKGKEGQGRKEGRKEG